MQADWFILMGAGGIFILLGAGAIIWDRSEKRSYYEAMSTRSDVREYLEHEPGRPEHGALKIGGWISIAVGLILLAYGAVLWFRG